MVITRTFNADKRYYLDEDQLVNPASLMDTVIQFNDMKMVLYNALYDKKTSESGPLMDMTYPSLLKKAFHTNDYYNCAVYTCAMGALSSQTELRKLRLKEMKEDLKARDNKIAALEEQLMKKQQILASVKQYILTGKWLRPYPKSRVTVHGKNIHLPFNKDILVIDYERQLEAAVRKMKTRLALIKEARRRAEKKMTDLEDKPPKRIVFGSKKRYRSKDKEDVDLVKWKQEFYDARHASMSLPGRRTSKNCNYLVIRRGNDLIVKCIDGKEAVLKDFCLSRHQDIWINMLNLKPSERKPVCYNFQLKKDEDGRLYIIASVSLELENRYCNGSFEDGCIAVDLNYDHVAVTDIDRNGNRIGSEVLRFDPELKTSGQISEEIGRIMSRVGKFCSDKKKPLVMEDLDTTVAKHGMRYGSRKGNRHASVFAYQKMTACLENQSYKRSFEIFKVDPSYTSQMGKFLFMQQQGISIHVAASYAVGLKGMGMREKLIPDEKLIELLPDKAKESLINGSDIKSLIPAWRCIKKAFEGVQTHSFYRGIPYDVLQSKKRKSMRSLSSEMKAWTAAAYC